MTTIDLRMYFPDNNKVILNRADGSVSTRYTLQRSLPGAPTGVDALYNYYMNLNKSGVPYMWEKEYWKSAAWCIATYGTLFMGDDQSITETGDWRSITGCTPNGVVTYKTSAGALSGLCWAPAGGLSESAAIVEGLQVWAQNVNGGAIVNSGTTCYSKTGLIELLPTYTPPYGRGLCGTWAAGLSKTYTDVAHIVMYHGTKTTGLNPCRCVGPTSANGAYYQSYKDYESYAIELWLANGIGIIQECTPFIENAAFWGLPNCTGDIFSLPGSWTTYIDQP